MVAFERIIMEQEEIGNVDLFFGQWPVEHTTDGFHDNISVT